MASPAREALIDLDEVLLEYDDVCLCGRWRRRSVRWEYDEESGTWRVAVRDVETGEAFAMHPV